MSSKAWGEKLRRLGNKRGLSEIVGYVLLIVFAVSMSTIVYTFLKARVPQQTEKCPTDVSVEIMSSSLNQATLSLNIDLRNRGLFSINGISVKLREGSKICAVTKATCLNCTRYQPRSNNILFSSKMDPTQVKTISLTYADCQKPTEIEILPMKYMEKGPAFCDSSLIKETLA